MNITYSSTWQRPSFLSSLQLQLLAGPDSLPLWLCRVCAFVLLRCFSCSHTVLPKEHSLGVIFFSSLSSCKCCIFLKFYLHFTTDYTCMIVYVTNNKEPWESWTLQHDFTIQLDLSKMTSSTSVRNLGVIFDDQLTFKEHIAKTAQSCRFALHNIRKIRPFLTEHAAQLLVQALVISRLDYCNALLAGLPSNTIKP